MARTASTAITVDVADAGAVAGYREEIRSVQAAIKRIARPGVGINGHELRHLRLQRGVTCSPVQGRELLLALKHCAQSRSSPTSVAAATALNDTSSSDSACTPAPEIQSVRICKGMYEGLREAAHWRTVVSILSQIQSLEEICVEQNLVIKNPGTILEMLEILQSRLPSLRILELNCRHNVPNQDVDRIAGLLGLATNLCELQARDLLISGPIDLSSILNAFCALTQLTKLDLGMGISTAPSIHYPTFVTSECIHALCSSKTVTHLRLTGLQIDQSQMKELWMPVLYLNTTLQQLHLGTWRVEESSLQSDSCPLLQLIRFITFHQWTLHSLTVDVVMITNFLPREDADPENRVSIFSA